MSLEQITNGLKQRIEQKGGDVGLNATVKFNFSDDGVVFLDGASMPNVVSNDDTEADCTITISMSDFISMSAGELDPTTAFMMGKLRVAGNMGIAMKLSSIFG